MQAGFLGAPSHWIDVLVMAAWGLAGFPSPSSSSAGNRERTDALANGFIPVQTGVTSLTLGQRAGQPPSRRLAFSTPV